MWVTVYEEHWYSQQRHDAPEMYGSDSHIVNTLSGEMLWRTHGCQPHDWWEAPWGPPSCQPAFDEVKYKEITYGPAQVWTGQAE